MQMSFSVKSHHVPSDVDWYRSSGFSLLEFIVSVGILVLLTLFVLTNFKTGQAREELRFAREELKSRVRQMQTFARTGQSVDGDVPVGGWGISFRCATFPCNDIVLFADTNGDRRFDEDEKLDDGVQIADDVFLDRITSDTGTPMNEFSIIAHSPYGEIEFYDADGVRIESVQSAHMILRHVQLGVKEEAFIVDARTTVQ